MKHVRSIVKMCRWMEVSRSGFDDWRNVPESAIAKRRGILAVYVQKSFDDSVRRTGTGGSTRTWRPGSRSRAGAGPVGHARAGPGALPAAAMAVQPH